MELTGIDIQKFLPTLLGQQRHQKQNLWERR